MGTSDLENGPESVVTNASSGDEKSLVKSQRIWDSGDRVTQLRYGAHIFWMIKD